MHRSVHPSVTSPSLAFRDIRVGTNSADEEGWLVLLDDRLAAVVVRLSDDHDEPELKGKLFMEAGFGRFRLAMQVTWADQDEARRWFLARLETVSGDG